MVIKKIGYGVAIYEENRDYYFYFSLFLTLEREIKELLV